MKTRDLVVLSFVFCALRGTAWGATPDAVPFALHDGGAVIVPVTIDGAGPLSFLLDTGATHSVVVRSLADTLGLRAVARQVVLTVAGEETRPVVRLGNLAVGSAAVEGLLVSVIPAPGKDLVGLHILGILGQDFLARHSYTIDYRHRELRWHDQPSLEAAVDGVGLALQQSDGRFLVELPQDRKGERVVRMVPDSGTDVLVVYERGGRLALPTHSRLAHSALTGLSARRAVDVATVSALRVGKVTLRDQRAAILVRADDGVAADGLLPLHLFESVSFDSRAGRLVVRPW